MDTIRNKVSESGIVSIDPEIWIEGISFKSVDLKNILFEGMILREKDLREFVASHNWEQYKSSVVALYCSSEAIIPMWAWMLLSSALAPYASSVYCCSPQELPEKAMIEYIQQLHVSDFTDKRVVVKGCSKLKVGPAMYAALSVKLMPVVKSLMFGEPCSTVPVYKKPKN
ncbi:MAG: DUF2480 family protein [Bacteroidota bacterium]|jgi:hypothetical protein